MILSSLISCNYSLIHFYLNCFIILCLSFLRFFYQIFLSLSLFSPSCLCIYTSLSCPVSLSLSLSTSIPIYFISLNINQHIYSNPYLHPYLHFVRIQHNNNNKISFISPKVLLKHVLTLGMQPFRQSLKYWMNGYSYNGTGCTYSLSLTQQILISNCRWRGKDLRLLSTFRFRFYFFHFGSHIKFN